MAQLFLFIYPISYILTFLDLGISGTIDQWIVIFGAFFLILDRSIYQNKFPKHIKHIGLLLIIYYLYIISSTISIWINPFSDELSVYHTITVLAKIGISIYVFYAIASPEDLHKCLISLVLFAIISLAVVIYFSIKYNDIFFMRSNAVVIDNILLNTIYHNPNILNRAILLILPLIYVYSFFVENKLFAVTIKIIVFLCLLLPIIGIARMATVAMALLLMVMLWSLRHRVMIFLAIPILILGMMLPPVYERFQDVLERGYAVGQRQETAEISLQVIKDNLLFGLGKRSVLAAMEQQFGPVKGKERRIIYEHNMMLSMLIEDGVVGFTLFIILLISYIVIIIKNMQSITNPFFRNLLFASLIGFLAFLLTTLTGGTMGENIFWYQVGLAMAIIKLGLNYQDVKVTNY